MAAGCEQALGAEDVGGEVIVADGCAVPLRALTVTEAGHPLPDARGERATRRILELVRRYRGDGILCLVSGGASSLLVRPRSPVTLADKVATTRLLLNCGADVQAVNTVRKHLSQVKGGGLLRQARTPILTLLLSDVIGNDPGTIGSGPTAPDSTTFADAWAMLREYRLDTQVPDRVANLLRGGIGGRVAETVKPDDAEAVRCRNVVVGSNRTALDAAATVARGQSWRVTVEPQPLRGDTTAAAQAFADRLRRLSASQRETGPWCLLAGGETTVEVTGPGRGGRNQQFALALARPLAGTPFTVLSAGTDGIDGPTDAAGAFVDGTTLQRAQACGLDVDAALRANDSYTLFSQLGDLLRCGPTGTNVMDIKIALASASHRPPLILAPAAILW